MYIYIYIYSRYTHIDRTVPLTTRSHLFFLRAPSSRESPRFSRKSSPVSEADAHRSRWFRGKYAWAGTEASFPNANSNSDTLSRLYRSIVPVLSRLILTIRVSYICVCMHYMYVCMSVCCVCVCVCLYVCVRSINK